MRDVAVRQATNEDREAIFAFIRQAYPLRWQFKIPERWEWEFVTNPCLLPGELPVWIAVNAVGEVVGQSCAMIERMKCGDRTVRVGWGVDSYVAPDYRGQGLARQLQAANCRAHQLFISVSMAATIRTIKRELGAVPVAPVTTFLRPYPLEPSQAVSALLSHGGALPPLASRTLARLLGVSRLDRVAARAYNVRRAKLDARVATAVRDVDIVRESAFDAEFDGLWESVSPSFDVIVKRDRVHLNWKYVRQPHIRYERFAARRGTTLCGYVVCRKGQPPEPSIGVIADLFAAPGDEATLLALLGHAVGTLGEAGAAGVVASTSVAAYQAALERLGFVKIREDVPMVKDNRGDGVARVLETGKWLLARGDHDWDQYPLAAP